MSFSKFYVATVVVASLTRASTAQAQIEWAAGAPGGTTGGSLQFNSLGGTDDAGFNAQNTLSTGISAAQIAATGGSDYTVSAWINSSEPDDQNAALAQDNRWFFGTGDQGLHLGVQNGNSGLTQAHWGNDNTGGTSVLVDTWVHATFTYDAATETQSIYFNGVLEGSFVGVPAPNNDSTDLIIGGRDGVQGPAWEGFVDDLAIFQTALSADDVATLADDTSQAVALGAAA